MKIYIASNDKDIEESFSLMIQLRPGYNDEQYLNQIQKQQKTGYRLALIKTDSQVVAAAGFRILENLVYGKFMYVDDLITDENNRSKGYGDKLFDFLIKAAKKEGCKQLHLDSGVQRFEAHRFYLRKKMSITAHHFGITLK